MNVETLVLIGAFVVALVAIVGSALRTPRETTYRVNVRKLEYATKMWEGVHNWTDNSGKPQNAKVARATEDICWGSLQQVAKSLRVPINTAGDFTETVERLRAELDQRYPQFASDQEPA